MKTYRGIVKGNTVILEQKPDVQEGAEAIVLVEAPEGGEQKLGSDHIPIKRELKERWGSFFIRSAESCMTVENRLIDTSVLVHGSDRIPMKRELKSEQVELAGRKARLGLDPIPMKRER